MQASVLRAWQCGHNDGFRLALCCPGMYMFIACWSVLMSSWTDTNVNSIVAQEVLTSNIGVCSLSCVVFAQDFVACAGEQPSADQQGGTSEIPCSPGQ